MTYKAVNPTIGSINNNKRIGVCSVTTQLLI